MNTIESEFDDQSRLNLLIWSMLCYRESDSAGFQMAARMLGERQRSEALRCQFEAALSTGHPQK